MGSLRYSHGLLVLGLAAAPLLLPAACLLNSKGFCAEDPESAECKAATGGSGGTGGTGDGGSTTSSTGGGGSTSTGGSGGMGSTCDNGIKEDGEDCDGKDLGGASCASVLGAGFTGTLSCKPDCIYDTNDCVAPPTCGDGTKNGSEVCDAMDFGGKTCADYKGTGSVGTLSCSANCQTIDFTNCSLPTCVAGANANSATSISMTGLASSTGVFHPNTGNDVIDMSPPISLNINGLEIPGQAVLAMDDAMNFAIRKGPTMISKVWYTVDTQTLSGIPECSASPMDAACLLQIAKSYRCTHAPYWEMANCPNPAVSFSAQPAASDHSNANAGLQIVLIDDTCP